ncbi:hypothetical protein SEA_BIG4_295 [Microbacterium phage Big4]|nr:hypothetical protein SEA_BIG4_295 [Microbacterium phage Big4]
MLDSIKRLFPEYEAWEFDEYIEGGQPNGRGDIESNDTREWFSESRESHHRQVYTIYGPWEIGPTPEVQERRDRQAAHMKRIADEARAAVERNRVREEDRILAQAEEIRARRLQSETE